MISRSSLLRQLTHLSLQLARLTYEQFFSYIALIQLFRLEPLRDDEPHCSVDSMPPWLTACCGEY